MLQKVNYIKIDNLHDYLIICFFFFPTDQFGDDTALVLVNAIYFKGKWQQPFNPNYTELKPFYVDQFTTKQVSTMYKRAIFNYGYLDNLYAEFIEIPYQVSNEKIN